MRYNKSYQSLRTSDSKSKQAMPDSLRASKAMAKKSQKLDTTVIVANSACQTQDLVYCRYA